MNRILFLVHTEYHLLITSKIIFDHFCDGNSEVEIIMGKTHGKSRLKESYDFSEFTNVIINEIYYDEFDRKPNKLLQELAARILNTNYSRFYFFQEHHPVPVYFAYQMHKRGTTVCLAPDGAKAYNRITKIAPRWSTLAYIWYHRFLIANGFYFWRMPWPELRYASFSFIDEVWLTYTEKYLNWNNKKLVKINNEFDKEAMKMILQIFHFSGENLVERNNIIFFINQNFEDDGLCSFEIEFLNGMRQQHPDKRIVVKLHPNTIEKQKKAISEIQNVFLLMDNVPAELYILSLTNSLVVSFWSTSNLTFNPECRFYWAYPMIEDRGLMIKYFFLSDPTDYIRHVHHVTEII